MTKSTSQRSLLRLGCVAEAAGIGIGLVDFKGRFREANRLLCLLLGYDTAELKRRNLFELCAPEHAAECRDQFKHLILGLCEDVDLELRVLRKDLLHTWTHLTARLVPGARAVVVTLHDSSDYFELLKEMEETLAR